VTRALLLLTLLGCAAGCAGGPDHSITVGYGCEVTGAAYCSRFAGCFPETSFPDCEPGWRDLCCGDAHTCALWAYTTANPVLRCDAMAVMDCGAFYGTAAFPEECQ
jgi:hypothetical protein